MAPLVPICQWWTAASNSPQAHMNALYAFFADTNYSHHWSIVATELSGTDVAAFVLEQGTAPDIQQITFQIDAGLIKGILDPDGTKTAVGDPATPTDPTTGFSGNESGEITFLRHIDSENVYSSRGLVAEYPDAVLFLIEDNPEDRWVDGGHFGKIYTPFNSNDEDYGLTGHGIVGGFPELSSSGDFDWFSNHSSVGHAEHCQIRVGLTASPTNNIWSTAYTSPFLSSSENGGLLNGSLRFPPYPLNVGTRNKATNTDNYVQFGLTKYLRMANTIRGYLTIVADNISNQAWQYMNHDTPNVGTLFLWDKTVVP